MNPVDPKYNDDFHKFVLQDQAIAPLINPNARPPKPFIVKAPDKSNRSKKDTKKDKKDSEKDKL